MKFENQYREYARLTVNIGANVQPGQKVVISCPTEAVDFAVMVEEEAYKAGAKDVFINIYDDRCAKVRLLNTDEQTLTDIPAWQVDQRLYYAKDGAAQISIISGDPEALKGVSPEKLVSISRANNEAHKEYWDLFDKGMIPWCIVGYPCTAWAKKVFPSDKTSKAMDKLASAIFKSVRIGRGDTVKKWKKHDRVLKRRAKILNAYNFKSLHFKNSLGTDLTVGLVNGHIWQGGSSLTDKKVKYIANMPTEEIFTMPDMNNVSGVVYASKPLAETGGLIENFSLTFKDGAVIKAEAEKGLDLLEGILKTDEGSKRLGEVALIPHKSPISDMGILFYDTLYDENASCHLALGASYAETIKCGEKMTDEEKKAHGANDSAVHVDFMFGTPDMNITGTTYNGEEIPVFVNGEFVF